MYPDLLLNSVFFRNRRNGEVASADVPPFELVRLRAKSEEVVARVGRLAKEAIRCSRLVEEDMVGLRQRWVGGGRRHVCRPFSSATALHLVASRLVATYYDHSHVSLP
jgi:hypothetical protein